MKKFLMMAFVAVMAFAAQAVTTSWNANSVTVKNKTGSDQFIAGKPYVLTVKMVAGTIPINTLMNSLKDVGGVSNPRVLKVNAGNRNLFLADVVLADTWHIDGTMKNNEWNKIFVVPPGDIKSLGFNIEWGTKPNEVRVTTSMDVLYNGVVTTHETGYSYIGISNWNALITDVELFPAADEEKWGGATVTAQLLPEPTVLALLALGVAGLALKRKVA